MARIQRRRAISALRHAAARRSQPAPLTDAAARTSFLNWLTRPGRRLAYLVEMPITADIEDAILKVPARAWTPAYDSDGLPSDGA